MFVAPVEVLLSENEVASKIKIIASHMFFKKKMVLLLMHVKMENISHVGSTLRGIQLQDGIKTEQNDFFLHFHLPLEQIFSYILNKSFLIFSICIKFYKEMVKIH